MTSQTIFLSKIILTYVKSPPRPLHFLVQPLNVASQTTLQSKVFLTHIKSCIPITYIKAMVSTQGVREVLMMIQLMRKQMTQNRKPRMK